MGFHKVIVLIVVLFLSISSLRAQSTISGYVTGTVTDPSKSAVANAKVTIENTATSLKQGATTDSDGTFHFEYVPPGDYALTITADGFNTWRESNCGDGRPINDGKCRAEGGVFGVDGHGVVGDGADSDGKRRCHNELRREADSICAQPRTRPDLCGADSSGRGDEHAERRR